MLDRAGIDDDGNGKAERHFSNAWPIQSRADLREAVSMHSRRMEIDDMSAPFDAIVHGSRCKLLSEPPFPVRTRVPDQSFTQAPSRCDEAMQRATKRTPRRPS